MMAGRHIAAVLLAGMLFGAGLTLSTMISPEVILSFLSGQDMGLMLVMGGALSVVLLAYQAGPRVFGKPWLAGDFSRQFEGRESPLDRDTLIGAAIFGIGWGLCGVCPGPAIAGIGAGEVEVLWALAGIVAGAGLQGWQASR